MPIASRTGGSIALLLAGLATLAGVSRDLTAQTFQGRVTGQGVGEPVATALVKLVDETGDELAISIADSAGVYRVEAEAPGVFRLVAERIGYLPFETPLLEAGRTDGVYPIDIEMTPAPVELRGFTVMTDRLPEEKAARAVQLIVGLHPNSLRFRPLTFEAIQDHVAKGRSLVDVVRWEFAPTILVQHGPDGPCFVYRASSCLAVYLNGFRLNRDFMPDIPLDIVYRAQVIVPSDGSIVYGAALLLYTEGWLR